MTLSYATFVVTLKIDVMPYFLLSPGQCEKRKSRKKQRSSPSVIPNNPLRFYMMKLPKQRLHFQRKSINQDIWTLPFPTQYMIIIQIFKGRFITGFSNMANKIKSIFNVFFVYTTYRFNIRYIYWRNITELYKAKYLNNLQW